MPSTMEELGLDKWSVPERRLLLQELYASIERDENPEDEAEFEEWEKRMIDERLAAADANPGASRPMEEVFAELMRKQ